jgi:hypothetical protein
MPGPTEGAFVQVGKGAVEMKKIYLIVLLLGLLTASACTQTQPAADTSAGRADQNQIQHLSITANGEGWDAPEAAPAGWTEIVLANHSQGMRQAAFMRLDDGKTLEDVFAALEAGEEGTPAWMTAYGGVSGVMPGETKAVTINLPAGQYIVIDPVPEADGVPGMAKGYLIPLRVDESDTASSPPDADLSIGLADYTFVFDDTAVAAGSQTIQVTNTGPQEAHEVVIVKLNEGATVQDFLAAFAPGAPAGPPPGQIVAGTAPFATLTENYMEVEFETGHTYALICFLPSGPNEGQPHFMLGMLAEFEVPQ